MYNSREYAHTIPGFTKYAVSNYGNVIRIAIDTIIKPWTNQRGVYCVTMIGDDGKRGTRAISRLVVNGFQMPAKDSRGRSLGYIAHLDGDLSNNRADNLKQCTKSDVYEFAAQIGRRPILRNRPVLDRDTGIVYPDAKAAGEQLRMTENMIITFCMASVNDRGFWERSRWIYLDRDFYSR